MADMSALEAIRFVVEEAVASRSLFYHATTAKDVYEAAKAMAEALHEIHQVLRGK